MFIVAIWSNSRRKSRTAHAAPTGAAVSRNVFMVYGRDEQARQALFEFIRALDLCPLEWENMVGQCDTTLPYLGDVIRHGFSKAKATVVLLTPEDEVRLHPDLHQANEVDAEKVLNLQPRPNVLVELGMALALHPRSTIVVVMGNLRPVADIAGLNIVRLDGSAESRGKLVERLKMAGCQVDDRGADWRNEDRFADLDAYTRRVGRQRRKRPPTSEGS